MSEPVIHVFNHNAMATQFQVRIAGEEKTYAAQTAQAARIYRRKPYVAGRRAKAKERTGS